ncbi:hypothetical protein LAT59_01655 [Candidatus Gracilibacteria bacterium]|nr:hypothetical protein [Candidatus Gracilibacteria bacterium]
MPANKRPRRLNYSVNKKGPIGGTKVSKAIGHYQKLQERVSFEGETKWLQNAMQIVGVKLKKYGIKTNTL